MLSLFNRFLNRIRSGHPIFGNRNLLIFILDYLDGEDLYQITQVCFSFRLAVQSVPYLEVLVLKYTMKQSNLCIQKLKQTNNVSQNYNKNLYKSLFNTPFIAMKKKEKKSVEPIKKNPKKKDMPDLNDEKWVAFVQYFYQYAEQKNFKILKKNDFDNEMDWRGYKAKFTIFYYDYIDYIKLLKSKENYENRFKYIIANKCQKFVNNLNFNFHYLTNYKFFRGRTTEIKKKYVQ
jgi:hypothetical protein